MHDFEIPVLVIGAGPGGLAAAATLAQHGVPCLLAERRVEPVPLPRATVATTRSMELLRSWGLEEAVRAGRDGGDGQPGVGTCAGEMDAGGGGAVVGDITLWAVDDSLSLGEMSWVFDPAVGGRGLAAEAARALLDLAFGHYGMHRVRVRMDARNTASARLCERLGFHVESAQEPGHDRALGLAPDQRDLDAEVAVDPASE